MCLTLLNYHPTKHLFIGYEFPVVLLTKHLNNVVFVKAFCIFLYTTKTCLSASLAVTFSNRANFTHSKHRPGWMTHEISFSWLHCTHKKHCWQEVRWTQYCFCSLLILIYAFLNLPWHGIIQEQVRAQTLSKCKYPTKWDSRIRKKKKSYEMVYVRKLSKCVSRKLFAWCFSCACVCICVIWVSKIACN